MDTNLKRTFFHELGHLFADSTNFKYFGFHKVEKIEFEAKNTDNGIDYEGRTIPIVPEGYDEAKDRLKNLPEKIASLVYGCYFQSIFLNTNFAQCFNYRDNRSNGFLDVTHLHSALGLFRVPDDIRNNLYNCLYHTYPDSLPQLNMHNLFEKTEVEDLIIEKDALIEMDLDKTTERFRDFFNSHEALYLDFIANIKSILDWDKLKAFNENF
jgi:hypothetical protein